MQHQTNSLAREAINFLTGFLRPDTRPLLVANITLNQISGNVGKLANFGKVDGNVNF